jgi:hypothetical protein
MCWFCWERHVKALAALESGKPPSHCPECRRVFAELPEDKAGNVQMALHQKDGVYQVLCLSCSDLYEQKRRDLYANTQYGRQKGIF